MLILVQHKHQYGINTTKTLSIAQSEFDIYQGNFRRIWKTYSLMESMGMGIYESKFVVLKHFGLVVLPKESSATFLFTIYILKSVFCKDNSCVKF